MELKGTILEIFQTETKGNNFLVRNMVLETDEQYPQQIQVQFVQDKTKLLDHYNIGDRVTIGINLRGKAWVNPEGKTKYFNTIQGWKIFYTDKQGENTTEKPNTEPFDEAPEMIDVDKGVGEAEDGLPF